MLGVLVIIQGLLSFHNFATKIAGIGEGVGEVEGFHVVAHVPTVQAGALADDAHKLVLGPFVRIFHDVGVQVFGT